MSREWIGLFFAVMACGSLQASRIAPASPKAQGSSTAYFDIAAQALTPWPSNILIAHARVALLLSIFATESSMKPVGAMWLSSAVRFAQYLKLHVEREGSVVDTELRRRLWWSIYVWERISSLGSNLPTLINDEDCDTAFPSSLEDRYIQPQGFARPSINHPPFIGLLATIQATLLYSPISQALRSNTIPSQTLHALDERLHATIMLFPDSYMPLSDVPLETMALPPVLAVQSARFLLFRHNMSPVCRPAERAEALRRCLSAAQDTAKYISRSLHTSTGRVDPETWRTKVASLASSTICLHLWRCMLMLCFRADYEGALMCLHLSAAVGDIRKVNVACGRNLTFFLDRLLERIRSGNGGLHQLEHDEEILAYVSGDIQGNSEQAWVWAGSEFAEQTSPVASPPSAAGPQRRDSDESMQGNILPLRPNPGSPENGMKEWDGWSRIEQMVRHVMEEHRARLAHPNPYYPTAHNPLKRVQLAPDASSSPSRSGPLPPPTPSSTSRISIANII